MNLFSDASTIVLYMVLTINGFPTKTDIHPVIVDA
jgi:hypothetical protein